ncbi:hypothetical protein [Stenotrophomonas sp. TWI587]|uniref:hypothetical protein n=1 Tax=Stenotrophomonas sp. TWI587 TaxID=3136783 RepID=UPI003209AA12
MAGGLRDYLRGFQLMQWLARVFVSAIIRRCAYVLVALVLAYCAVGKAHAQQQCANNSAACTEGQAYQACNSELSSYITARKDFANQNTQCKRVGTTNSVRSTFEYKTSANAAWMSGTYRTYYWTKGCDTEPNYTGVGPWSSGGAAKNGSLGCRNGCDGLWSRNADSSMTWMTTGAKCPDNEKSTCENYPDGYYWNAVLNVCEPPEGKCDLAPVFPTPPYSQ